MRVIRPRKRRTVELLPICGLMLTDIVTRGEHMGESKGEKKIDRRIIKTQRSERRFRSFIEKGIDKITVSALAREADIDRKTFYLHFRSIDELIQQEADTLVERVAGALTTTVHDDDPVFLNMRRVLVELANVVGENETLYQHVISSLSMDQMVNTLFSPVRRAVLESDKGSRLAETPARLHPALLHRGDPVRLHRMVHERSQEADRLHRGHRRAGDARERDDPESEQDRLPARKPVLEKALRHRRRLSLRKRRETTPVRTTSPPRAKTS